MTRTYHVTAHAIERYQERVKPWLGFKAARAEVEALVAGAEFTRVQPDWADEWEATDGWLVVCDSIAFPVANGYVLTCLGRAGMGDEARRIRTRRKRGIRRERRFSQSRWQDNRFIRREAKSRKPSRRFEDDNEMGAALVETADAPTQGAATP